MLTAIIVDDEPKAIEILSWELTNFSRDIRIINTFTNPEDALEFLKSTTPDCLFLDVQMPTMDGFQFLNHLPDRDFAVIITTAYDEYAIKALKHEAIDYLLKPIDPDDLGDAIQKIIRFNSRILTSNKLEQFLANLNQKQNKKITLNTEGKLVFLDTDDILFIQSDGNYSTFYLNSNQKLVITKKLKDVNLLLPDSDFFRIHNSYIVNLGKIKEYMKSGGYVVVAPNHKIPVARQRRSSFLEKL